MDTIDAIIWFLLFLLAAAAAALGFVWARLRRWQRMWMEVSQELHEHLVQSENQVGGVYRTQQRFRQEIQQLGTAFWDWNLSPSRLLVSDPFIELTGYRQSDIGNHPKDHLGLIHPAERAEVARVFREYFVGERAECELEFRFLFADGDYRWVRSRVVAFRGADGRPERVVGSLADITTLVRAIEERDRLFNLSLDMLGVGNYEGYMQQVNPAWVRVTRWSRDDLMDQPMGHFIHAEDAELWREAQDRLEAGLPVEDLQCRFRCRDNTYRWLSWSSFPYPEQRQVFTVVRDITLQKEAQFKLRDSQERLRSLSNQLSLVEDRQRRQLAEAIHDGLAQQLFGLRAIVTLLRYPDKIPDLQATVTRILEILDETMEEARTLSFELFPAELQEVGLEAALGWLANEFQERNGIRCTVRTEQEGPELSEDLRAMAYQSVRELFNNVRKHAEATEIRVTINSVDRFMTVRVEDDGAGFETSGEEMAGSRKLEHEGFGLFSIRERVRSVGGRMLVDSRPGAGCRVFLSFPVDPSPV